MLNFVLVFLLSAIFWPDESLAFFGFNMQETNQVQRSSKYGCLNYKSLHSCNVPANRPPEHFISGTKTCRMTIDNSDPRRTPGFCECTFDNVFFGCANHPNKFRSVRNFNCEKVCKAQFKQIETDNTFEWLKNTIWLWNNWREIKFQDDGIFWAPTYDCENQQCTWKAKGDKISIMWGDEGLHTVRATPDKQSLTGIKFNGEQLFAKFIRSEGFDGAEDDLYEILGVDVDATEQEIKKRYRKLSREIHPDKLEAANDEERKANEDRFMKVQRAYEVLKEDDSRMIYDTGGMEAIEEMERNKNGQGQQRGQDIFSMFFGGGMGGQQQTRGQDANLQWKVSLSDVFNGREVEYKFNRRVVCRRCATITDKNRERCSKCRVKCPGEYKMVQKRMGNMIVQQQEEVPSKERCKMEDAVLNVIVERGMKPGEEIKFPRKGEQTPGVIPGDVIIKLMDEGDLRRSVNKPYDKFIRSGDNLKMTKKISLKEALTGFQFDVLHLDAEERYIRVENEPGEVIYPGQVKRISGEGMPVHNFPSQRGDLLIEFVIEFPKQLTSEQESAIKTLF